MKIESIKIDPKDVKTWFPARVNGRDVNKGTYGHVFIYAGSEGFVGAPILAAEAAARTGAGLVTLVVPREIQQAVMSRVSPVVMTQRLESTSKVELGNKSCVAAIGPGLGDRDGISSFISKFISRWSAPLLIDADALNALSRKLDRGQSTVKNRTHPTILTPHPGEMGRLLGIDAKEVQSNRLAAVTRAARFYNCIVVLKGSQTLVSDPHGTVYFNTTGNPGMATGGTGDALTGVISALLAQQLSPIHAAVSGVYLHGLAGDIAAKRQNGTTGLIATDLITHLPNAIAHCQEDSLA